MEYTDYIKQTEPLTDWENEPSIEDLKQDYESARSDHDYYRVKIQNWLDNLHVQNSALIKKRKGRSTIVPKLIRKQAEWRYAGLSEPFLSQESLFKAQPKTWKDKRAAQENVFVLNHQFNTNINRVQFIDEYVRTAVDEGTAIVRVGWEFEEEEQEVEVPIYTAQPLQDPTQIQAAIESGQPPIEQVQVGSDVEIQTVTTVNGPTLEICNFNDIIIDPTCRGNLDKAQFIIYRFDSSLTELEKSGKYENLDKIDIERNSILSDPDDLDGNVKSFQFKDKPRKKISVYEYWGYWDIDGSGIVKPFVAAWVGNTVIRMEESPFPDKKLPFVLVQYLPKRWEIYGEPDGELLEDNQKIIGAVTRGMIDIMGRSAAGQKATRVDALDLTNRRKFEAGEDYEFQAHVDPRQAFYDHTYPEMPASAQFMLQLQQSEAESLTGVKAFNQGLNGDSLGQTATGVRGALDASAERELGIIRRLADGLKKIGYKIAAMNAEFLSDEEIIRITDEDFVSINRENLVGKFDLTLDISSAEADNAKAQELAFMLQTVGPSEDPELRKLIMADIARLRKMPELEKKILGFQPKPDEMQQQLAMLQMQKLQAEIQLLEKQAQSFQTSGMLDLAKAQTEGAKARQLTGQSDKIDLDFLEQQTGAKHRQELEKQGAQAEANIRLKEREAQLKDGNTFLGKVLDRENQKLQNELRPNGKLNA